MNFKNIINTIHSSILNEQSKNLPLFNKIIEMVNTNTQFLTPKLKKYDYESVIVNNAIYLNEHKHRIVVELCCGIDMLDQDIILKSYLKIHFLHLFKKVKYDFIYQILYVDNIETEGTISNFLDIVGQILLDMKENI